MAALITTPRLMAIGGGALAELPGLLARLGLARPLIVTDPYIAGCGILERATALLDGARDPLVGVLRYRARPDDRRDRGRRRAASGRRFRQPRRGRRRQLDRHREGDVGAVRQWRADARLQGAERHPARGPPVVAIPTTAGTGSEVTRFTVITDTETDEKMLIAGLACCPTAAIVDFELTSRCRCGSPPTPGSTA